MSNLLSQGGFGCVYYPGITCSGKASSNKKVVTKIQKKDSVSDNEIKVGEIIKQIPNYQLFFLPVINHCSVHLASLNKNVLNDCEVISDEDKFQYILMNISYVANKSFFDFLLKVGKTKKHVILDIIETYSYLLNSISILLSKNVIHFDLKNENILYNTKTNNPLLIDFGISIPISSLTKKNYKSYFYIYAPEYYIWPLEVHLINFIIHKLGEKNQIEKTDIIQLCENYTESNKALNIFSDSFKESYKKSCINSLSVFIGKNKEETIQKCIALYHTWDNYSLSILYLRLIDYMFEKGFMKNKILIYFSQLLLDNISPYGEKRKTIDETMKLYKDIFFLDENNSIYMSLIENFDYNYKVITTRIKEDINDLPNIGNK